jgi:DUF177 domain-containing protein
VKIWLDQVREEPFSWDETEGVALESLDRPEVLELSPVRWQGQVTFADPSFLLRGRLSYSQTLACGRCLVPHAIGTAAEIELLVVVEAPPAKTYRPHRPSRDAEVGEQELGEVDLNTLVIDDECLDTQAIVLEQLQLNVPMKPLCRPDCQGLCPQCGADRNTSPCSCVESVTDPRWAGLAAIKVKLDSGEDR